MNEYIEQYKKLHKKYKYGTSSEKLYDEILPLVKEINPKTILDFGCGQSKLVDMLPALVRYRYDPAILEYATPTMFPVDLVICIDVLEHIPENELYEVIYHIASYSDKVIFDIGTQLATHILPNGQNAHCTVKPIQWWLDYLRPWYEHINLVKDIRGVKFLCKTWE